MLQEMGLLASKASFNDLKGTLETRQKMTELVDWLVRTELYGPVVWFPVLFQEQFDQLYTSQESGLLPWAIRIPV